MNLSREEARVIAEEAADKAVHKMMTALGIDTSSPESVIRAQSDFAFLRRLRDAAETAKQKAIKTAVGLLVTAVIGWAVVSFGWHAPGKH